MQQIKIVYIEDSLSCVGTLKLPISGYLYSPKHGKNDDDVHWQLPILSIKYNISFPPSPLVN